MTHCPVSECRAPLPTRQAQEYAERWGRCEQCDALAAMRGELTGAEIAEREGREDPPPPTAKRQKRETTPWNAALAD